MKKSYIVLLFAVLLVVIFSIQNATPVAIKIFSWDITPPLSLTIVLSFVIGALFATIFSQISFRKKRMESSKKDKIIKEKDEKIATLEDLLKEMPHSTESEQDSA